MKSYINILCLLCFTALVACGLNNTMYNARNYYKAAQARPLNTNGKPNAQAIDEYTKAIKKCGIIISERKKSALLDDAVFLMAKALYYKGNSAFQAKDQFENLLRSFPDSPYVSESHIYIAKILREINQPKDAEKRLEEFVRNPRFKKDHPKALLVLTDFAIKDKDFTRAQFWLERIISDYPKTKEFREAYYMFGKNYYEQKDFTGSLEAFQKMHGARGIDKSLKMDASYYIALNQFELGDLEKAYKNIKGLVKTETRPDKIPPVRVLKARILFARADSTAALSEIEAITKTYPRTESAAEAYYYLGQYYYYQAGNNAKAIANYNRVRTEFSTSPLAALGQSKATALGNVTPKKNLNSETGLNAYLDYYYQGAESFLSYLALPDSAIAYYQKVISEKDVLSARRDSLQVALADVAAKLDSLALMLPTSVYDSLGTNQEKLVNDSLEVVVVNPAETDSLAFNETQQDSLGALIDIPEDNTDQARLQLISKLEADSTATATRIKTLNELLARFDSDIIPFCLFAIGSVLHDFYPESERNAEILNRLQASYPGNKFSKALLALQNGQTVRLIDPAEEAQEAKLDELFGKITAEPDSAIAGLQKLLSSEYPSIKLAANFRLGWYYSFENVDTLAAPVYLKAVLDDSQAGDYATLTRRFWDGSKFLLRGKLVADSLKAAATPADSAFALSADSLQVFKDIPAFMDSLAMSFPPALAIPDSLRKFLPPVTGIELPKQSDSEFTQPQTELPETPELIPDQPQIPVTPPENEKEEPPLE